MDQTGVHLVPAASWTYAQRGSASVAVVGAEDKRQITACLASSLHGDLLPLQLIFAGKTARSLPASTPVSKAARVHLTFSDNHWSSLETMKQWVGELLVPYAERCIQQFELRTDARILLVLDVWAVHKSEAFRLFLRTHHPRVHLVFVPACCTSQLQVADVALQRPFKSGIRRGFERWAAEQVYGQIQAGSVTGFKELFGMPKLKPLVLQWAVDSWTELQQRKDIIANGWYKCVSGLYDVHSKDKRILALGAQARGELDVAYVPDEAEDEPQESEHDSSDEDELDITLPVPEPTRARSARVRQPPPPFGYRVDPSQIAMTEDSN
jgi:hypothetical protein